MKQVLRKILIDISQEACYIVQCVNKTYNKVHKCMAWKFSLPRSVPALKSWNTVIKFRDFDVLKQKLTLSISYFTTCNFSQYGILS